MENDLISRSALLSELKSYKEDLILVFESLEQGGEKRICSAEICGVLDAIIQVKNAPAVDAVEVVRCKDCKHGVWNEDEQMYQCVEDADYDPELAMYIGFICYEEADFYCKRGERRADDGK